MADPVTSDGVMGVKFATLLAGFAGGVISLSFIRGLSTPQAILAVMTGAFTANYMTPLVLHYLSFTAPELQNGVAFIVGLTAMNIIPGFLKLSEMFKRDPRGFISGGDK